jgi:hypothetical protein
VETRRRLSADGESDAGKPAFAGAAHNYPAAEHFTPERKSDIAANDAVALVGNDAVQTNPARERDAGRQRESAAKYGSELSSSHRDATEHANADRRQLAVPNYDHATGIPFPPVGQLKATTDD